MSAGSAGIGKSSLAGFVRWIAERHDGVVGCHVYLGGVQTLEGVLQRVFDRLLKDSIERPWHQQMRDSLGERVRTVGLFGATLELRLDSDDMHQTRLCVLMVGLDDRRRQMIAGQPSLARVFELVKIAPWSAAEVEEFYRQSFRSSGADVSPRDLDLLVEFTGGLPVLAHEIGDAVWRVARTPALARSDIATGIVLAAATVGSKYLGPQVLAATRSARYRSILEDIAQHLDVRFTRTEIIQHIAHDDRAVLDNLLRRMRQLGVLEAVPGTRGEYHFPNRLSWLYFRMSAKSAPVVGSNRQSLR